jgi:hypothetical protein
MPSLVAKTQLRQSFFEYLFEEDRGYLCIAVADKGTPDKMRTSFRRMFFEWPISKKELKTFIEENAGKKHLWFSVHLFNKPKAIQENAVSGRIIYADLDRCKPYDIEPTPSIATETSPGRFHALWVLNVTIPPAVSADYSRRVAYKYSENGADKSGWDVGQLLRVPYTWNYKYPGDPEIDVVLTNKDELTAEIFEDIEKPELPDVDRQVDETMPDLDNSPDPEFIFYKYARELQKTRVMYWYAEEPPPDADWSGIMWRMINTCLEVGITPEETFIICAKSQCNKYERDRRPIRLLWREVLKANNQQLQVNRILNEEGMLHVPDIAPEPATPTVLDAYQSWAQDATDAIPIYHELAGFIVLSSILSSNLRLETQYGTMVPNLWGLMLGESTLTRKTTAMTLARNLLAYIDESIEIGSEGSIEGTLQELSTRPRMASLFYRDEVAGFIESITRKEYLAGMVETLTHLYDAPRVFRRMLKKEVVHVQEPIFLFFGGGIQEEVYGKVDASHVTSGFLPRFLIVSGKADRTAIRPTARPSEENMNRRVEVYKMMEHIYHTYNQTQAVKIGTETIQRQPIYQVELTDKAWQAYQTIEAKFTDAAYNSSVQTLALPTFERLSRSCLKMSMLLSAARQEPTSDNIVVCDTEDITNAGHYIQRWTQFSIEMLYNAGKSGPMRMLERVRGHIIDHPGILHSQLMRHFHLRKREMDEVIDTLLDRGEISKRKSEGRGGGYRYWPL